MDHICHFNPAPQKLLTNPAAEDDALQTEPVLILLAHFRKNVVGVKKEVQGEYFLGTWAEAKQWLVVLDQSK